MTNSRWKMNRIGLVDFWYYDEEEFYFLDGRMLLRGSNGSGKSVTMQSFIPLILDGNMRPERLDPFGSRARKMENYLLEEGDGREERTGYLYLEFKRETGNNYLTIGIGMRARKNKKLDTWYFYIQDGRRIGKDFFLYKDTSAKIAYSRQELKNRIGDGGRVMESQTEYMESVNHLIFGFETAENYKEMLDLLIQLRSPKLSKDFKPSVLCEILSDSLLTLSEDDLRPMSEAVENMDAIKINLDALRKSIQAAKQIDRVYHRYNQITLYQKAERYLREIRQLKKCRKEAADGECRQREMQKELEKTEEEYQKLWEEERVLREKRDSLNASDAVRLKEQEEELGRQIEQAQADKKEKERKEQENALRCQEIAREMNKQSEKNEQIWGEIAEILLEMQEEMEGIPFDEAAFFAQDLQKNPRGHCDFRGHSQLLSAYAHKVDEGIWILKKEKQSQEKYDAELEKLDRLHREQDRAERNKYQLERQLQEVREEQVEKVYLWEKENQELKVAPETMQELSRRIYQFDEQTDYGEIRDIARSQYHYWEEKLQKDQNQIEKCQQKTAEEWKLKREEADRILQQKELTPVRTEAVLRNRKKLSEKGIPFYPFYQTVDFEAKLSSKQSALLEEALLHMGVLDALIVPEKYREEVLTIDRGSCDRYIFSDAEKVKDNVTQALIADNPEQDSLLGKITECVLQGIGFSLQKEKEGRNFAWLDLDGRYQMGIIEGTITGEYEPQFIGEGTRALSRQRQLEKLEAECRNLYEKKEKEAREAEALRRRIEVLKQEFSRFPGNEDIRLAAKEYGDASVQVERLGEEVKGARKNAEEAKRALSSVQMEVQEICKTAYLTPRLDEFEEAKQHLDAYQKMLTQIQVAHNSYQNGCSYVQSQQDFFEIVKGNLEDIRYDLSALQRRINGLSERIFSVREQMKLTNYQEIQETLEICIRRLSDIPGERERAVAAKAKLQTEIEQIKKNQEQCETQRLELEEQTTIAEQQFQAEYSLEYTEHKFAELKGSEETAQNVYRKLSREFEGKSRDDCFGQVQSVYHENRGSLVEYNLTMDFILNDGNGGKRIDLTGKYRGVVVKFKVLFQKLEEEAGEQERLLSDKDRELFEDILANTISQKIRARIYESNRWVERMNTLMRQMRTSSGLRLSLKWLSRKAELEEQLDTKALVALLQKDVEIMREEEVEQLSRHFRSKIAEARKLSAHGESIQSFHAVIRDVLDYRKWFEFKLEYQKTGEPKKDLIDRAFFTFSGGEKAMSMYVPLFSAVVAKYKGAAAGAPRIISLDEAFAGVDETNIQDMFRLMVDFEFDFIINSQILWGDYETVPALAVYQLIRPENAKYVSVIPYTWNGKERKLADEQIVGGVSGVF